MGWLVHPIPSLSVTARERGEERRTNHSFLDLFSSNFSGYPSVERGAGSGRGVVGTLVRIGEVGEVGVVDGTILTLSFRVWVVHFWMFFSSFFFEVGGR